MRTNVETRFELPKRTGADTASAGVLALLRGDVTLARPEKTQVDLWTLEAAQGSPQAQYELARTLAQTAVISADNRAAVKWLRKAVEKEHTASQYLLGLLIARGQGVRPDPEKAVELFRKAAVMGNKDAQYDLGRALLGGSAAKKIPPRPSPGFGLPQPRGTPRLNTSPVLPTPPAAAVRQTCGRPSSGLNVRP